MDLSWIITAILGAVSVGIIYWFVIKKNDYWKIRGVPHLPQPSLFTTVKDIVFMKKSLTESFIDLYKLFEGEKFYGYFQMFTPTIMIKDLELINRVLIKDFTHFEDRGPPTKNSNDLFTLSVASYTGDEWRNVRHKLTPTFTSGKLKNMFPLIQGCADEVVDYLKGKENESFEAREFMMKYVINVIGNIAFGLKINALNEKDEKSKEFLKMSKSVFEPSLLALLKAMMLTNFPKIKNLLNLSLTEKDTDNFFRTLTSDVIKYRETTNTNRNDFLNLLLELRRKEKENFCNKDSNITCKIRGENEQLQGDDKELLEQLKNTPLGNGSPSEEILTDDFIAGQAFGFISGGSDATAAMLSFVLYELAAKLDLQKKVQDEVSEVLASTEFNFEAVKKMTYMEQFINETFRLHPLIGILARMCTKDYKIPGTEVVIEKGTIVQIPVLGIHKDPQYFPDPEKFNPDRFESMDAIPKNVYFPFGGGPRICIAMRLAILEIKVLVATLLQKYTVILSEKTKLPIKIKKRSFMQHVEGGIWIKFQNRIV